MGFCGEEERLGSALNIVWAGKAKQKLEFFKKKFLKGKINDYKGFLFICFYLFLYLCVLE